MVFNGYFVRIFTVALLANLVSSVNCNAWHVLPSILRVHRASKVSAAMELLKSVWYFLTAENTGSQHAAWDEKSAFCHMSRVWVRWKASCFIFDLTNEQPLLICPAFLKHTGRYLFDLKVPKLLLKSTHGALRLEGRKPDNEVSHWCKWNRWQTG